MSPTQSLVLDLPDEAATASLAARLAGLSRRGDVIGLSGPLGAGKTSFARAFIRALGEGREEVPSPTFTLVEVYALAGKPPVFHFDLYRLNRPEEAYDLGIEEAMVEGISLIEWPERLGSLLPDERLVLVLEPGDVPEGRRARLDASPGWEERLERIDHG